MDLVPWKSMADASGLHACARTLQLATSCNFLIVRTFRFVCVCVRVCVFTLRIIIRGSGVFLRSYSIGFIYAKNGVTGLVEHISHMITQRHHKIQWNCSRQYAPWPALYALAVDLRCYSLWWDPLVTWNNMLLLLFGQIKSRKRRKKN